MRCLLRKEDGPRLERRAEDALRPLRVKVGPARADNRTDAACSAGVDKEGRKGLGLRVLHGPKADVDDRQRIRAGFQERLKLCRRSLRRGGEVGPDDRPVRGPVGRGALVNAHESGARVDDREGEPGVVRPGHGPERPMRVFAGRQPERADAPRIDETRRLLP